MTRPKVTIGPDRGNVAVEADRSSNARKNVSMERLTPRQALDSSAYSISGTVVAVVSSTEDAAVILAVVMRGASAVIYLDLTDAETETFLDQLERIADVRVAVEPTLDGQQQRLLEQLSAGMSLGEAAAELGLSRRTADRRVAAARATLGVHSTAEALVCFDSIRREQEPRPVTNELADVPRYIGRTGLHQSGQQAVSVEPASPDAFQRRFGVTEADGT